MIRKPKKSNSALELLQKSKNFIKKVAQGFPKKIFLFPSFLKPQYMLNLNHQSF
ncbi:hypothetical protein EUBDOL_00016 [Amedibacillus dolichus DSM 3991]|uniref:Uncharacterized protein n=1 Tax=Amedibacillus dolichus DSM 3991 TaxID=428127 RepID=A8R7N5_9FIRM|nr:hypothetical protein EUBDOL_00016 [Amedibacillus dolichus DSM 3991]